MCLRLYACPCLLTLLLQRLEVGLAEFDMLVTALVCCHLTFVSLVEEARVWGLVALGTLTICRRRGRRLLHTTLWFWIVSQCIRVLCSLVGLRLAEPILLDTMITNVSLHCSQ